MDLKLLGLSEYEERAYTTLVKLGKASASGISRESNVSYGKIYEVLGRLEKKGLVRVVPEKSKKFVADNPSNLIKLIESKEKTLQSMKKDVEELKQFYETKEEEAVHIVRGKMNFYKIERELGLPKRYMYNIKYNAEHRPEWVRQHKEHLSKDIEIKELTRYDDETKENVDKWRMTHKNIRKIANNGVAISIRDDRAVMIAMIKSNTTMLIKDKPFVEMMKRLFLGYYGHAEKV